MNKRYVLAIYLAAALRLSAQAQTDTNGQFGPQQVIANSTDIVTDLHTADLDGDGDQDILSAYSTAYLFSVTSTQIVWYKNNGQGNFEEPKVIAIQEDLSRSAIWSTYTADLDGDGDQDVLAAFSNNDKIAWYENDGNGNFSEQQVITTQANGVRDVYAADLDQDGDQDVLSASFDDGKIAWYKNDGRGNFSKQQVITTQAEGARKLYTADLDGDGDQDVLSASSSANYLEDDENRVSDDKIAWYENDGAGNFSQQQVISIQLEEAQVVYAADLDQDGDQDVLASGLVYTQWYKNDGQGNFGEPQTIVDGYYYPSSGFGTIVSGTHLADLDNDGDTDVLSSSFLFSKGYRLFPDIVWYENDGQGNFNSRKPIYAEDVLNITPGSLYAADLDQDGDQDVLSGFTNQNIDAPSGNISWFENLLEGAAPSITSFTLVDNNDDRDLFSLQNADTFTLFYSSTKTFTVRANAFPAGQRIRRVEFRLNPPVGGDIVRSEYAAPYSLFSDDKGDYFGRRAYVGTYQLTATPYYLDSTRKEVAGRPKTIRFTITAGPRPLINSFTLVNNNTDQDIQLLEDGDRIRLENLNTTTFTVRANVVPGESYQRVRRVEFRLDAPAGQQGALRSEYAAPYSLFSDNRGDYFGRKAYAGEYKLIATPYYLDFEGEETAGTSETIRFTFTGSSDASQSSLAASAGIAYPVPFNETLTLKLGSVDMSQTQIQLVHGYGKVYQVSASQMSQDAQGLVLNLAQLPSGPYTVRVMSAGQVQTFRVSKE